MPDRPTVIAALLRERAGYQARGLPARVAQVDAELAQLGHTVEAAVDAPPAEQATKPKPRRRRSPGAETAVDR